MLYVCDIACSICTWVVDGLHAWVVRVGARLRAGYIDHLLLNAALYIYIYIYVMLYYFSKKVRKRSISIFQSNL